MGIELAEIGITFASLMHYVQYSYVLILIKTPFLKVHLTGDNDYAIL